MKNPIPSKKISQPISLSALPSSRVAFVTVYFFITLIKWSNLSICSLEVTNQVQGMHMDVFGTLNLPSKKEEIVHYIPSASMYWIDNNVRFINFLTYLGKKRQNILINSRKQAFFIIHNSNTLYLLRVQCLSERYYLDFERRHQHGFTKGFIN